MAASWMANLLTAYMGLKPGERFLALVDPPLQGAGEALCAEADRLGARSVALSVIPDRGPVAITGSFVRRVKESAVIVGLLAHLDLSREPALLRGAVSAFHEAGTGRWGMGIYVDEAVLEHDLCADLSEVTRRCSVWADRLGRAEEVRLVTEAGTDLRLRVGGRPVHQETGNYTQPGAWGNLPAGEVFLAPHEASAQGHLVVDLCLGDIPLDGPVRLTFAGGKVVAAEGGRACQTLRERLGADPWRWTVGEVGIGTNPAARIRGRVTTDEKALGTVHVALGANRSFGGENPAPTHYDCVIRASEIHVDGVAVATE